MHLCGSFTDLLPAVACILQDAMSSAQHVPATCLCCENSCLRIVALRTWVQATFAKFSRLGRWDCNSICHRCVRWTAGSGWYQGLCGMSREDALFKARLYSSIDSWLVWMTLQVNACLIAPCWSCGAWRYYYLLWGRYGSAHCRDEAKASCIFYVGIENK